MTSETIYDFSVAIIVPLFEPTMSSVEYLLTLPAERLVIVAVDDGSSSASRIRTSSRLAGSEVKLISNIENQGIAHAINVGIREALKDPDVGAILTLDQDSALGPNYLQNMFASLLWMRLEKVTGVAAGSVNGHAIASARIGVDLVKVEGAIQSGMVIPRSTLEACGLFEEALFIDCVETEFQLRTSVRGYDLYANLQCELQHQLGEEVEVRFGAKALTVSTHSAERRYYISRNRIILFWRYFPRRPRWALHQAAHQTVGAALDLLAARRRTPLILAILLGFVDALRGRRGRMPPRYRRWLNA